MTEIRHKAIHLLSLREHSRKELQHKLLLRDYALPDVLLVLDEFVKKDLQSDERFVEAYVRSRRLKGYGPERIQMELQQRGVAEELICASIDEQDESWHEAAIRVYQKKFGKTEPKTFQEKVKRQQFMRYRGFDSRYVKFIEKNKADNESSVFGMWTDNLETDTVDNFMSQSRKSRDFEQESIDQLREIELGIEEADAGRFASQEEVEHVFKKWL